MVAPYAGPVSCAGCGSPFPEGAFGVLRCRCGLESLVFRFRPFRKGTPNTSDAVTAGAPCAYHVGNPAASACSRCGSFLCTLCETALEGKTYCTACFERLRDSGAMTTLKNQFPRPHTAALACACLSLFCFFSAPVSLPLAAWQGWKAWKVRTEIREREGRVLPSLVGALLIGLLSIGTGLFILFSMGRHG